MRSQLSHRLGWYVTLSSLVHALFISWGLRYLHTLSEGIQPPEPVRVTIVAPELPGGPSLAMGKRDSVRASLAARPIAPRPTPPSPMPLIVTQVPTSPASLPLPTIHKNTSLRPSTLAPILTRVPELSVPPVRPSSPPSVSTRPSKVLAMESTPSHTVVEVSGIAVPTAPVSAPSRPQRAPNNRSSQAPVFVPRPRVAQFVPPSRAVARVPRPVPSRAPAPGEQTPNTEIVSPAPPPLHVSSPSPPAMRRELAGSSLARLAPPPVEALPALASAPAPRLPPVHVSSSAAPLKIADATTQPTPRSPLPPTPKAALLRGHVPQRRDDGTPPQEVIATPKLARFAPRLSIPSRLGPGRQFAPPGGQAARETPPHLLHRPEPAYPLMARRRGWEGTVILDVEMRADGTMGEIKIARSSGYALLDEAAKQTVKKWTHVPATRNGAAITRWAVQKILFRLD